MNHIALICDDAYVLPTAVTIQSIKACAEKVHDCKLCIHVCTPGLTNHNESVLTSLASSFVEVQVICIDFNKFENKIARIKQQTHVSIAALIKFELPNLFQNIDQILYLDSDIVVKGDFLKIFSVDLTDFYLAAVFEFWKYLNDLRFTPSNMKKNVFFFNSGVMFFNLKKMRHDSIVAQLWDYKLNHSKTKLMDQECFNAVCGKSVRPLSIKWNFNPVFKDVFYLSSINKVYAEKYVTVDELVEDSCIIHYVGKGDKPWIYKKAKLRYLWDSHYEAVFRGQSLELQDYTPPKKNFFRRFLEIKQCFGITGFLNFLIYKIKGGL